MLPVLSSVPAVGASYHCITPPPAAVKVAAVPEQIETAFTVGDEGSGFTVTFTGVRVLAHPPEVVST